MAWGAKSVKVTLSNTYAVKNPGIVTALSIAEKTAYVSYPYTNATEPYFALDECPLAGGACRNLWKPKSNWNGYFMLRELGSSLLATGYGTTGAPCTSTRGLIFDPRAPTERHLCLSEGTGVNDNLAINVGRCLYDTQTGLMICSGAPGSRNLVVAEPWSGYRRIDCSKLAPIRGRTNCVPLGSDKLICVAGGSPAATGTPCHVFEVSVDDLVKASNSADVTSLPSYRQLATASTYCAGATPNFTYGAGRYFVFLLADQRRVAIYDYEAGSLKEYNLPRALAIWGETSDGSIIMGASDDANKEIIVYRFDPGTGSAREVATIQYPSGATHAVGGYPAYLAAEVGSANAWLVFISDGSGRALLPAADAAAGELAVYDMAAGAAAGVSAKVYAHRLLQSISENTTVAPGVVEPEYESTETLPAAASDIAAKLGVNGKWALNVVPLLYA